MQAVILAGGLGTRLGSMTAKAPKAMMIVAGKPFIDYQVDLLRENGVDDLVVCVGYLGAQIERHLGDGKGRGVRVRYSRDGPKLLGPAGALKRAEGLLDDRFFVTYGDAYLRAPYGELMDDLVESGAPAVMAVFRNEGRYGRSDVAVEGGLVVRYDKKLKTPEMRWINFGVSALRREALARVPVGREVGEEEFYGPLIKERGLRAFEVRERFYEIGTPESLAEFERLILGKKGQAAHE